MSFVPVSTADEPLEALASRNTHIRDGAHLTDLGPIELRNVTTRGQIAILAEDRV